MKKIFILAIALVMFNSISAQKKILIITSNQHFYGDTDISAANHFEEIVVAYDVFVDNGFQVDVVSPNGGAIPIGYLNTSNQIQKKYLYDASFMGKLKNTLKPSQVNYEDYGAVYYSGGGSAMFGVADDRSIQKIAESIYQNSGIVSAVCHGTAGIVHLKDEKGESIYKGKKITGFPDAFEHKERAYYTTFPFKIDNAIKDNGGKFEYSSKGWDNFNIKDGRLITGQDPSSVNSVAKKIVDHLNTNELKALNAAYKAELEEINLVLTDYIEGTANGQPDRVRNAFHEDLNLYFVKSDSLEVWEGKGYVNKIKVGEKNGRQGEIISVDYEKDAAMAKIEILIPEWRIYTDYLMLLKIKGKWKIIHKSFTYRAVTSD